MIKYFTTVLCLILSITADAYQKTETFALNCDKQDHLRHFRDQFFIPKNEDGSQQIYFCGHSLGLQPKTVPHIIQSELDAWANLAVEGHFKQNNPWYTYHEFVRDSLSRLVGAKPEEVVAMN